MTKPSLLDLERALHHRAHLVDTREHLDRLFVEEPPRLGQPQRPRRAVDQFGADFGFELLDLPAQRRLGDVQPVRGAREIALAGDRHEITQLPEVHTILYPSGIVL